MNQLIADKNDKLCAAKVAFMLTLVTCLAKIIISDTPDYSGMGVLIGSVGAIYFGRSHTKANTHG